MFLVNVLANVTTERRITARFLFLPYTFSAYRTSIKKPTMTVCLEEKTQK
jgi:hypothetical protein